MRKIISGLFIILLFLISSLGAASMGFSNSEQLDSARANSYSNFSKSPSGKSGPLDHWEDQIVKNDVWLTYSKDFKDNNEKFYLTFDPPQIIDAEKYSILLVPECSYFTAGSVPILPYRVVTFTFPPGTEITNVNLEPVNPDYASVSKPILPAQPTVPIVEGYMENFDSEPKMDMGIYKVDGMYPENWYKYSTGMGLNPHNNERELFLTVHVYPVRYNPVTTEITYITSAELKVSIDAPSVTNLPTHTRAGSNQECRDTTHDMVIICTDSFKNNELVQFADRKTSTGVDSIIITITDITSEKYFTCQGRDTEEKIKYFIYNAVKSWDIKYVLLIGDHEVIPTRHTHVNDGFPDQNEASDLYYADVFDSTNNFCDWDDDSDDNFSEYNGNNIDKVDLYPDVHLGRFPASNVGQLGTLIDKTINYEYTAIGQEWFNNAILCGLDTFPGGTPEGEYLSDHIAEHYLLEFNVTKLYESDSTLTTQNIITNMNNGTGFTSFSDHGTHGGWGGKFSSSDMKSLTNGNKLPFINFDACLTGEFDSDPDCIAEEAILNPNGGAVAVVASSRVAYGSLGPSHINSVSGYLNVRLYHNFLETTEVAGELLTYSKIDYLRNVGSDSASNFKTLVEFNYFGDPSLLLGGLPTAIFNLECEDNTSTVKPGESTEYNIQIENTDIQSRQIQLSTFGLPQNWEATISEDLLLLNPDQISNVTLTVTVGPKALAGSQGNVKLIASLANIDRTLCTETKTIVGRIYGMDILANKRTNASGFVYPGKNINFTFQVYNLGNDDDTITLDCKQIPEEGEIIPPEDFWDFHFSNSPVIIPPFSEKEIIVQISVPTKTVARNYNLSVKAKLAGNSITKSLDLKITVFRVYGVNITCPDHVKTTDPGVNLTFQTVLENEGNHRESFLLRIPQLPHHWKVAFQTSTETNDTLSVAPFSKINVDVVLSVPQVTIVGDYNMTVTVQCLYVGHVVSSGTSLNVSVNRIYGILLNTPITQMTSEPGESIYFFLELMNLGNDKDSANIEIINRPENWEILIDSMYDILMAANSKLYIGINIIPYEHALVGKYDINLRAVLASDNSNSDLRLNVNISRLSGINMSCFDSPMNISTGIVSNVPIHINHLGNEKDSVTLSIPNQIPDCSVILKDSEPISLKAFGEKDIELEITANKSIVAGIKTLLINAMLESTGENYTYNFKFKIRQFYGITLSAAKKRINTQPGTEIKFDVIFYNTGNGEDTYTVMIEGIPSNWRINFPTRHAITLKPFQNIEKTMFLNIPSGESYHEVDIEVRVLSTGDNKTNARLELTAAIEEEKFMVMGLNTEIFGVTLVVIIIVILLLFVALIKRRSKKRSSEEARRPGTVSHVMDYTTSSDGSQVQWKDPGALPAQYNPPTPIVVDQPFELQVQQPKTYRQLTYSNSSNQDHDQPLTYNKIDSLSYDNLASLPAPLKPLLPPSQEEIEYTPPELRSSDEITKEETQLLEQLDAELTAESLALAEVEADAEAKKNAVSVDEVPTYHENDEFSIDFNRPKHGVSAADKLEENIEE